MNEPEDYGNNEVKNEVDDEDIPEFEGMVTFQGDFETMTEFKERIESSKEKESSKNGLGDFTKNEDNQYLESNR